MLVDVEALATGADGLNSASMHGDGKQSKGYPRAGPGRHKGNSLQVRESLHSVLVVLLSNSAYLNLTELFDPEDAALLDLNGVRELRHSMSKVTDRALRTKAWDLSRSGSVGVLLKFGAGGSRDSEGRHQAVAVEAKLTSEGVVCTCSAPESCLGVGMTCSLEQPMVQALDAVRAALDVTMADLFEILSAWLRISSRAVGRAVLYGPSLSVVRMPGGSWPLAVVRKTRSAKWICLSCRTSDGSRYHATAATDVARRAAQGPPGQDSESENATDVKDQGFGDESTGGEALGGADGADGAAAPDDADVRRQSPVSGRGDAAAEPSRTDRTRQAPRSMQPRHLVPPRAAQVERAFILRALDDPSIVLLFPAADLCPYCRVRRRSRLIRREVLVECGGGVAKGTIYVWKCGQCNFTVIPAGKDCGIVITSSSTAYSEVFLFETSVNLSRNGCSLRSSAYLRQAYRELCEEHVYPDAAEVLSSLTTLRKAIVSYLSLVIAGLPAAVTQCLRCMRSDGSYAVICFDGLQLGYRLKFMGPFSPPSVSVSPIARASVYAHVVKDEALAKALGGVMSSTASSSPNKITTLTAMRGNVMAIIVLNGYVRVDGVAATF